MPKPVRCPQCAAAALSYRGVGTQRAELALAKCFPTAKILRMDADSTSRRHSHDDILGAFRRGDAQILIGTQMIAKGLDFPNVTLVGVLNADSSLMMPDFRAGERTFQLLSQVAGRAGRAELPGEVFIQSRDPTVGIIRLAAKGDYRMFAEAELAERRSAFYPPYCHLAVLNLKSRDLALVGSWADMYAKSLAKYALCVKKEGGLLVVGEALPSAIEKADDWYRWQVVLRAPHVRTIVKAWLWLKKVRPPPRDLVVALDVDAYNLV